MKRRLPNLSRIYIPIVVIAIIFFSLRTIFPSAMSYVQSPAVISGVWVSKVWDIITRSSESIRDENIILSEEIIAISKERTEYELIRLENENLRSQLDFFKRHNFKHETSNILSRSVDPVINTFLIDSGYDDGGIYNDSMQVFRE